MPQRHLSPNAGIVHLLSNFAGMPCSRQTAAAFLTWSDDECRLAMLELEHAGGKAVPGRDVLLKYVSSRQRSQKSPGMEFVRLSLEGEKELDCAAILSKICGAMAERYHTEGLFFSCVLLLKNMLTVNLAGAGLEAWRRFINLAIITHPYTMPFISLGEEVSTILSRARSLAFEIEDIRSMAALDIILGTEVTRKAYGKPASHYRDAAMSGRTELEAISDWDLQTWLSPYLGILDYIEGNYQRALGQFSLRSKTSSSPADHILYEQCTLYEGHSASLLGNFHLATNIMRSSMRQAMTGNSFVSLSCARLFLSICMLAQGELEEALELLNSILESQDMDSDMALRISAGLVLSYYHRLSGNLQASYSVFRNSLGIRPVIFYYFVCNSPFFMEMLYTWELHGFPPVPELNFRHEVLVRKRGYNRMQKSVALRLDAQLKLARAGCLAPGSQTDCENAVECRNTTKNALGLLKESLMITQELGLSRERAKTCVLLACCWSKLKEKKKMQSMAMEAWSLVELLRQDPWILLLSSLVPAPLEKAPASNGPETLYDTLSRELMKADVLTEEQFFNHLLHSACRVFGVARACLFSLHEGKVAMQCALRISNEEIHGSPFLQRMEFIDKSTQGVPVFTAVRDSQSGANTVVLCIPIACDENERFALYMDGDIFPELATIFTADTLQHIGRIFSWEILRFRQKPQVTSVLHKQPLPDDENLLVFAGNTMRMFLEKIDRAARSDAPILLFGETGTGKELVAKRIHRLSGRPGSFIAVNLANLPEELFESEMLGHEKGAFTGAVQKKIGLLELADNGTLFLDEIADISPKIQIKLLRLLQERSFTRLGSTHVIHSNFRLVSATNRNLRAAVMRGLFREDLFYRICVIPFTVPPLRDRPDDIVPIARHYLRFFAQRYNKPFLKDIAQESLHALPGRSWPGNVRELKNALEEAVITSRDEPFLTISTGDSLGITEHGASLSMAEAEDKPITPKTEEPSLSMSALLRGTLPTLKDLEQRYILAVLEHAGGRIDGPAGAAALLGMKKANLYYRLGKIHRTYTKDMECGKNMNHST